MIVFRFSIFIFRPPMVYLGSAPPARMRVAQLRRYSHPIREKLHSVQVFLSHSGETPLCTGTVHQVAAPPARMWVAQEVC